MILRFTLISVILFSFFSGFVEGSEFLTTNPKIILSTSDVGSFAGDAIGYKIINIGDLDENGTEDLATIAFLSNSTYTKDGDSDTTNNYGAIQILFMNDNGDVKSTNRITIDDKENGLGSTCLHDPNRDITSDNIFARSPQSLESISFLGNLINNHPTLAIGYSGGDFKGADSNSGNVLLVELSNDGNVLSCNKLSQLSGFSNEDSIDEESFFGTPIFTTDVNSDGNLDLVVGTNATVSDPKDEGYGTELLFFLFDNDQTIVNIFVINTDILQLTKFHMGLESGHSLDGQTKIVVSSGDAKGGDNVVRIINLNQNQKVETSTPLVASYFTPFGFMIDMEANSPYENSDFFDSNDDSDGDSDAFGYDIYSPGDLNGDKIEDLIVGAFNDDEHFTNAGSLYFLLMDSEDRPKDVYKLTNPNTSSDDSFGHAITSFQSNDKTWLAVGAPFDDTNGDDSGKIYIYDFDDFPFFPKTDDGWDEVTPEVENIEENNNSKIVMADSIPKTPSDTRIWLTTKNDFVQGFNHLIITGEIQGQEISSSNGIPEWIMTFLGETWYDEQISDSDFYTALQYLFDERIVK